MKKLSLTMLVILCLTLAGCGGANPAPDSTVGPSGQSASSGIEMSNAPPASPSPGPEATPSPAPAEPPAAEEGIGQEPSEKPLEGASDAPVEEPEDAPESAQAEQTATLYIGTRAQGFTEYPLSYEGELTPELLIQGIADLTGWDLTLAEPVVSGKGGMSVCRSENSALFTGPPELQKDEFHMFSAEQLAETLLDSIQKTLQEGFTLEGGNPDALDVWYFLKGEQPLVLPELGLSWALDRPYQWAEAEKE